MSILEKKHLKKCLLLMCLVVFLICGINDRNNISKAEDTDVSERTGLKAFEVTEIPDDQEIHFEHTEVNDNPNVVNARDWSIYGNDYCYNQLTTEEKAFYDSLDAVCLKYISTDVDAVVTYNGKYYIDGASYEGLDYDRAIEIAFIYVYQNPQYYFITTSVSYSSTHLYFQVYDEFVDGASRAEVTDLMFQKVDSWLYDINTRTTDYEKEKRIYEIVCANIDYVYTDYDQSAYGAIIEGECVCAGYTKMMGILLNGAGIEAVGVTSPTHGWNVVKIDGVWYNVDATWDDGAYVYYSYFNKPSSEMEYASAHDLDAYYDLLAPQTTANDIRNHGTTDIIPVTSISVEEDLYTVPTETDNYQIDYEVYPANATDKTVVMTSSETSVAEISNQGLVTVVNGGATEITVTTNNNSKIDACTFIVTGKATTPDAPVAELVSTDSITLVDMPGCEYSKDMINWQRSNVFSGLAPNREYTFYARKYSTGYVTQSDVSQGTKIKTLTLNVNATADSIYLLKNENELIQAGLVTTTTGEADLEYRWLMCKPGENPIVWTEIQGWQKNNQWLNWKSYDYGNMVIVGQVRVVGNEDVVSQASIGIEHHPHIIGQCQMPYTGSGGGFLIGLETCDNPNQSYTYELLVLDCTLFMQGKDAWIWSTGRCYVPDKCFWAVWQPQYGYYWTLFRVYDENGVLIDEVCYGFSNI